MNNLIIKHGFQSIKTNSTLPNIKGFDLFKSDHVINVEEHKLIMGISKIIGYVLRQTSVTLDPYKVELKLDGSRNLKHASCQCPAGSGGKCKHIAAAVIYVNSEDGTSKTDMPQQWGKPSKAGEIIYIKGKQISELFTPKRLKLNVRSLSYDDLIQHHSLLEIPCSLNINLRQEIERTCQHVIDFIVKDVENQFITENNNKYLTRNYNESK